MGRLEKPLIQFENGLTSKGREVAIEEDENKIFINKGTLNNKGKKR